VVVTSTDSGTVVDCFVFFTDVVGAMVVVVSSTIVVVVEVDFGSDVVVV